MERNLVAASGGTWHIADIVGIFMRVGVESGAWRVGNMGCTVSPWARELQDRKLLVDFVRPLLIYTSANLTKE